MTVNKYKVEKIILTIFIFAIALGFIFPFIWMISTSFKFEADVMEFPFHIIPEEINTSNYKTVWQTETFPVYYRNSIFVTVLTVLGDMCLTSMAAYSFARLRFRGKNIIFSLYLSFPRSFSATFFPPFFILFFFSSSFFFFFSFFSSLLIFLILWDFLAFLPFLFLSL